MLETDEGEGTARSPYITVAMWLGFGLVILGMFNNIPSIPGLDAALQNLTGMQGFTIRKFPYEWLYPFAFVLMMIIVALRHSLARDYGTTPLRRKLGLGVDLLLILAAVAMGLTYLIEISAVCLIDTLNGDRATMIAESLKAERAFAESYGLPVPTSVDDPKCLNTTGIWLFVIVAASTIIFLGYTIKVWGLPLVMVAIVVAAYTLITIAVWYFYGADDINKYFVMKLGGEPRELIAARPKIEDILVSNARGFFGQFLDILLNTVFPYIVLGALFGASAGGQSMIKLAFRWTRKLRGGPAHAAIVSSALFGTITGGPVLNVLSTGTLTIPMMTRRGFSKVFSGGVEAAASSGGQIMPPVMGVAAFVLAALTVVPYREVIIAATIPALAYFGCLFLSVVFQARKQRIEAVGELTPDMHLSRQDGLNLLMIIGPILLILLLLLTPKEAVGCGIFGSLLGVPTQNVNGTCLAVDLPWGLHLLRNSVGDAGAAGWWAAIFVMGLLFLDPVVRAAPGKIVTCLSKAGITVSTLFLMFVAVSIIDFCLNLTGVSNYVAQDMIGWLRLFDISASGTPLFLFVALLITMLLAVLLGMGMPTVPAYINVALLMGPVLAGLGIATFTAHMFIFYFAVASAITPPVAIAAFAAASITKADPMVTGFSAVRSGIVMFVIPFVFAFYPELLLIDAALIDPNNNGELIAGYDADFHPFAMLWLLIRLVFGLYLLASALSRFDTGAMPFWEIGARLILFVLVLNSAPMIHGFAIIAALGLMAFHRTQAQRGGQAIA